MLPYSSWLAPVHLLTYPLIDTTPPIETTQLKRIRRGGVTDIAWVPISQLPVLASHKPIWASVDQGALELFLPQIRKCNFLSDPYHFGGIFYEKVHIETFHISSKGGLYLKPTKL